MSAPVGSLLRHAFVGALTGLVVCGVVGVGEGLRQAWIQLASVGSGKDAGVFLVLFGPFMAGGYLFIGAIIGGSIGASAGAGVGVALGVGRAATAARTELWGRRGTRRLVHAGFWGARAAHLPRARCVRRHARDHPGRRRSPGVTPPRASLRLGGGRPGGQ